MKKIINCTGRGFEVILADGKSVFLGRAERVIVSDEACQGGNVLSLRASGVIMVEDVVEASPQKPEEPTATEAPPTTKKKIEKKEEGNG